MVTPASTIGQALEAFIYAAPTPYHAVAETVRRLAIAGFTRFEEGQSWAITPGTKGYVVRGESSIVAFIAGQKPAEEAGLRLIGAHTDSPNLRVKPQPTMSRAGTHQLAVEIYGGVLLHTWLDRDLALAGRVLLGTPQGVRSVLVNRHAAIGRVPSLAIHLNRAVNTEGLILNPQLHMPPVVALDASGPFDLRTFLAESPRQSERTFAPTDILSWDLCFYEAGRSPGLGARNEMISCARLDNLASCHASLEAFTQANAVHDVTRAIVFYDHEECGSLSAQGADSPFFKNVLERIALAGRPYDLELLARAFSRSFMISADMAHGLHPNYMDRHEPGHAPILGRGPVIKVNNNQSYATDGESAARFASLCRAEGFEPQYFVTRSDLPCGSTIGPITAGWLGIRTVDVGNPMLSMHSCREMAAASDHEKMIGVMRRFFSEPATTT